MRDLYSNFTADTAIENAEHSAGVTSPAVDLAGFNSAAILLGIGVGGDTFTATKRIDFLLTHSNDGTAFDPVLAKDILGAVPDAAGLIKSLQSAHATGANYRFGYKGGRRFIQVEMAFNGTHAAGTPISVAVLKGRPTVSPQPAQS